MRVKEIYWIRNKGYRIVERKLGYSFGAKYCERSWEIRQYEELGEDYDLIKESRMLDSYRGLTNDYDKDLQILQQSGQLSMNVSTYEAMKFVVENWDDDWSRSPYSLSFYSSKDIDWGYKPEGSLRVSDHWNFGFEGEHCPTAEPVDGWAVCRFENGLYQLIKKF
ncbi:hypothetical protein [Streptococcus sp. zg-JUN1979]|uniref:hypothetical protein n=1 Tax=Streptococcus sp. zg-JUN1979 TaxID=3391450 RepID=UPI0039A45D1E